MGASDGHETYLLVAQEVAPAFRGRDYGRRIAEEVIRTAAASGAYKLWVQSGENNLMAQRTWLAAGAVRSSNDRLVTWTFQETPQ